MQLNLFYSTFQLHTICRYKEYGTFFKLKKKCAKNVYKIKDFSFLLLLYDQIYKCKNLF